MPLAPTAEDDGEGAQDDGTGGADAGDDSSREHERAHCAARSVCRTDLLHAVACRKSVTQGGCLCNAPCSHTDGSMASCKHHVTTGHAMNAAVQRTVDESSETGHEHSTERRRDSQCDGGGNTERNTARCEHGAGMREQTQRRLGGGIAGGARRGGSGTTYR